ncbi:MAG: hypothetical protein ACE5LB_05955 [Acidiferrobacterales bacterium]
MDLRPGERACHGWQALGFRAMQDSIAKKGSSGGAGAQAIKGVALEPFADRGDGEVRA